MQARVCATATAAFFSLPRPNRRASRRNRAPGLLRVRAVDQADSTSAVRRCRFPGRAAARLRLPADSLSPGASPAQAASRAGVANRAMSPPVSATITSATRWPMPGMVTSRAMTGWNGAAAAAARTSSSAILTVRWSQASRCSRHIWPCEAVNRPSQTICSPSILRRNTPLARLASTPGLRSPAISASVMVRPGTPGRSLATEPGLDPGVPQHLGQPLALADAPLDELLAVAGPLPQRCHLRSRDDAGPQQPVLVQPGDPLAVPHIGLAARHTAHVRRVADAYLDLLAGQRVIHRPPVHPRGLHRHGADPYLRQPGRHLLQLPPERQKPPHRHRPPARLTRHPHRDPDHLLAHVDPGDARMDDTHRHLLPQPPIPDTGAPPAEPAQDRDPVTRASSSNPGTYRAGSSVSLPNRHAAPRSGDVSGRRSPKFHPYAGATTVA